jgi:uncharacterized protein (TIGR02597 family)
MKLKTAIPSIAAALLAATPFASAQNATTDPVGFVTTNISASTTGTSFATTFVSPTLLQASAVSGSAAGTLSGVTSTSVTVANAGWTVDDLSTNQAYVMLKSGNASGMVLRVSSNTADTATIDSFGADLTTLGIAGGDSFQLIQGDTVLSMFGTTVDGVVGGNSTAFNAGQTDRVVIRDTTGNIRTLYFDTSASQWRRVGSSSNQGTIPISPYSGVYYLRISTSPISMVTTGSIPTQNIKLLVPTSGAAFFGRVFPTDGTINDFGFQNIPGWTNTSQSGITSTNADKIVTVDSSGNVRNYYFNGTNWLRVGSGSSQNATPVPIGGAVYTVRSGSGAAQVVSVNLPYSL